MLVGRNTVLFYKLKEPISEVIAKSKEGFAQIDYDYEEINLPFDDAELDRLLEKLAANSVYKNNCGSPAPSFDYKSRRKVIW